MSLDGMVLRCEKTGKLFYNERDAKQHSEDTGISDFAQVSLEEKVWQCEETGKICFNEQQVDLHKRRVPEAKTFTEKTVADLQKAHNDKLAAEGEAEVESEEDMLLRAAGKKPKGKGAAKPEGPPIVTKESVEQLVEMGFTETRAQKALVKVSNGGVEPAINWLAEHLEDADIDDPMEVTVKTQEELGEEAAQALAGGSSQLSAEEKKAKLDEALAKARAKKLGTSVEEEKQKERERRQGGKAIVASKRELEQQQRERDIEARKREKREFEEHRKQLREQLARDKAERAAKNEALGIKPAVPAPAPAPAPAPEPSIKPEKPKAADAEAAAAAAAGFKRSYDEPELPFEEARDNLCALLDTKLQPFLDMFGKLVANIAKAPADVKYRKVRLSNAKLAEGLVHVAGARQYMRSIGWKLVETEFLELPVAVTAESQTSALAELTTMAKAAQESRRIAELEARKKEAAERVAKQKAEREAIKAQMMKDRGEVAARGPAEAAKAKALPTVGGGIKKFEQEEDNGQ